MRSGEGDSRLQRGQCVGAFAVFICLLSSILCPLVLQDHPYPLAQIWPPGGTTRGSDRVFICSTPSFLAAAVWTKGPKAIALLVRKHATTFRQLFLQVLAASSFPCPFGYRGGNESLMMAALGTTPFLTNFFFSNLSDGFVNCLFVSVFGDLPCITISFLPGLTITKRPDLSLQDRGSQAVFQRKICQHSFFQNVLA